MKLEDRKLGAEGDLLWGDVTAVGQHGDACGTGLREGCGIGGVDIGGDGDLCAIGALHKVEHDGAVPLLD